MTFMMPNMDPRALKRMMESMGIKQTEIDADRVIIQCKDKNIVIESPSVTAIDAQGARTFQVSGSISEQSTVKVEISDDDVATVASQTGVDNDAARSALEEANGDIAEAIMKLKGS